MRTIGMRWIANSLWCAFALLVGICNPVFGAETMERGRPNVEAFHYESTGIHSRIFSVAEDQDGVLYVSAPDIGAVGIFNGAKWSTLKLASTCISLACSPSQRVWLCLDDEIGYLEKDSFGRIEYRKFDSGVPQDQLYFSHCEPSANGVRFISDHLICDIDDRTMPPNTKIRSTQDGERFIGWQKGHLFVKNSSTGKLYHLENDKRRLLNPDFDGSKVECVVLIPDGPVLYVMDNWRTISVFKEGKLQAYSEDYTKLNGDGDVNWIQPFSTGELGCATSNGFFLMERDGEVVYQLNENNGILTNNVRGWGELPGDRIWMASDAGFTILDHSRFRYERALLPFSTISVYDLTIHDEKIYAATGNGVYVVPIGSGDGVNAGQISLNPFAKNLGESFQLFDFDGVVYAVGYDGFVGVSEEAKPFSECSGRAVRVAPDRVVALTHGGSFAVLDTAQNPWKETSTFTFPSAQPYLDSQGEFVWFSGLNGELKLQKFERGWDQPPITVQFKSEVEFTCASAHGVLGDQFLIVSDAGVLVSRIVDGVPHLVVDEKFSGLLPAIQEMDCYRIVDCGGSGLVLMGERKASVHHFVNGRYVSEPTQSWELIGGCCSKAVWDEKSGLLRYVEKGKLISVDVNEIESSPPRSPVLLADSSDAVDLQEVPLLKAKGNIAFEFGLPPGGHPDKSVQFQFRLEGHESGWSDWSEITHKEFTNLGGGDYTFRVRARTGLGLESESKLAFQVEYPWFQSAWFAMVCIGTGLAVVFGATSLRTRQLRLSHRNMERLVTERAREIEQKKQEIQRKAALLDQKDRQNEAERLTSFDTLVAGISHDFNNLLMVISSSNELIENSGDETIKQLTANSQKAVQSANELCSELSDYSGSLPIELVSTSMQSVVRDSKELIENALPPKVQVEFEFCDCEENVSVLADPAQLKRALLNLVINAAEVADSKVRIETQCHNLKSDELESARFIGEAPSEGEYMCLLVSDDGPGIDAGLQERLFDPFVSSKKLGRGLGLAIVMKIVGRHGGIIFVDSKEGGGCEFRLCLPAVAVAGVDCNPELLQEHTDQASIMLVDDEALVLKCTKQILEFSGHEVDAYESGLIALERFLELDTRYDCIVVDVSMPEISGVVFAETVLEKRPDMPVVLISGYSGDTIAASILNRNGVEFLKKPFTRVAINEAIHNAISSASNHRPEKVNNRIKMVDVLGNETVR